MDQFSDSQSKEVAINKDDETGDNINTRVQNKYKPHEKERGNHGNEGVYSYAKCEDIDQNQRSRQLSCMHVGEANNNESQVQDLKINSESPADYDNNRGLSPAYDNKDLTKKEYLETTYETPISKPRIYFELGPNDDTLNPQLPDILKGSPKHNHCMRRTDSNSTYTKGRIPGLCSRWRRVLILVSVIAVLLAAAAVLRVFTGDDNLNCKTYHSPMNGHVNYTDSMHIGSSVHISCELGFWTNGVNNASCLRNGAWDRIVTCELVDCGPYKPPQHTHIVEVGNETTFNSTLNVACDIGFKLGKENNDSVRCNKKGHWIGNTTCESEVVLSASPENFVIDKTGNLTCDIGNIPEWTQIEFSRINNNNVSFGILTIVVQSVGIYNTTITGGDNIKLVVSELTLHAATVVVMFDVVQCSDAFRNAGDVVYTCNVFINTSITLQARTSIRIQHAPTTPTLTISQQVVEGYDTWTGRAFICEMNFPEPNGHITIESDYGGEFTTLLSSLKGKYETEIAFIDDIKLSQDNCWHRIVVIFGLKNVTMQWHRKHIRCITTPSNTSVDKTTLISDNGVVKVIPEHFCERHGKEVLLHPYNCSLFVLCDKADNYNTISGVPGACEENFCFNTKQYTCPACSDVGGCPLIDIYFDNSNTLTVGDAATLVCIVEDFDGLADITITRDNGEQISSTLSGDKVNGFSTIEDKSYLNVSSGVLSLSVDRLECSDESTYRCVPTGRGKTSDGSTSLQLGC